MQRVGKINRKSTPYQVLCLSGARSVRGCFVQVQCSGGILDTTFGVTHEYHDA